MTGRRVPGASMNLCLLVGAVLSQVKPAAKWMAWVSAEPRSAL